MITLLTMRKFQVPPRALSRASLRDRASVVEEDRYRRLMAIARPMGAVWKAPSLRRWVGKGEWTLTTILSVDSAAAKQQ